MVNWRLRNKCPWHLNRISGFFVHENAFENVVRTLRPFCLDLYGLIGPCWHPDVNISPRCAMPRLKPNRIFCEQWCSTYINIPYTSTLGSLNREHSVSAMSYQHRGFIDESSYGWLWCAKNLVWWAWGCISVVPCPFRQNGELHKKAKPPFWIWWLCSLQCGRLLDELFGQCLNVSLRVIFAIVAHHLVANFHFRYEQK